MASDNLPALIDEPNSVAIAPPPAKKGTRLPEGWSPARTDTNLNVEAGFMPDRLTSELERFRDHWAAQPGQKGVKLDWDATWRNWLRRDSDYTQRASTNRPKTGATTTDGDWQRWSARLAGDDQTRQEIA